MSSNKRAEASKKKNEKRVEAKQERERLAAIEKSQQERKNLREKYGNGGLPSDYTTTERKAFDDERKYQEKKAETAEKTSNTISKRERLKKTYRDRGGVLRYPFEAITEKTDYLQIDIVNYESVRDRTSSLVGRTNRISPNKSRMRGGLVNKSLINKGTILLQIPSQVQDGNSVDYGSSRLNNILGAAVAGGVDVMKGVGEALGEGDLQKAQEKGKAALKNALETAKVDVNSGMDLLTKSAASAIVGSFGGNVTVNQLLQRESGQIFNPNMELLFNGPTLRTFRFSFKMTPRSQEEAKQCKLIIRSFKMNMAPKVTSGREGSSLFLNTPNVFELRYKSGIRNHPFLHRFKQCFLTDISVNYTGEGVYATYEGREPVSMIMDLTFKELEPIYDQDYFDEFGFDADTTVGF